jgi:hypothetical protein
VSSRPHAAALCVLLALAPAAAACSSGSHHAPRSTSASSKLTATRWWSNTAEPVGSTIDPAAPQAAAAKLHPSTADYCGMLRQTVAAGRSILPGVTPGDPALTSSTKAFVAEIGRVAPAAMSGPWHVLGGALVAFVASGGNTAKVTGVDTGAVARAASAIAADARTGCHVDLSAARR